MAWTPWDMMISFASFQAFLAISLGHSADVTPSPRTAFTPEYIRAFRKSNVPIAWLEFDNADETE